MQNWKIVLFKKKVSDVEPSLKIQYGSYVYLVYMNWYMYIFMLRIYVTSSA